MEWIRGFALAFVPIFVAVDAIGILPLYMGLTEDVERRHRRRIVEQSIITALVVAIAFVFLGKSVFALVGVTVPDFMVAGGVLLFIIATSDIVSGGKPARSVETIGAVPLGVPLMVGPAVLTTSLLLAESQGLAVTILALAANIILAGGVLMTAGFWIRLLGQAGSKVFSKVANLLLAAIAVMIIRRGLSEIIAGMAGQ